MSISWADERWEWLVAVGPGEVLDLGDEFEVHDVAIASPGHVGSWQEDYDGNEAVLTGAFLEHLHDIIQCLLALYHLRDRLGLQPVDGLAGVPDEPGVELLHHDGPPEVVHDGSCLQILLELVRLAEPFYGCDHPGQLLHVPEDDALGPIAQGGEVTDADLVQRYQVLDPWSRRVDLARAVIAVILVYDSLDDVLETIPRIDFLFELAGGTKIIHILDAEHQGQEVVGDLLFLSGLCQFCW